MSYKPQINFCDSNYYNKVLKKCDSTVNAEDFEDFVNREVNFCLCFLMICMYIVIAVYV